MSHYDCKECHQDPVSGHAPDCSRGKAMDELIAGDADLYDMQRRGEYVPPMRTASARIMGDKGRENPAERPYTFDRYVGGKLMAEGITIEREATLESAIARAVQLCPKANAPTVLVLRDMETSL